MKSLLLTSLLIFSFQSNAYISVDGGNHDSAGSRDLYMYPSKWGTRFENVNLATDSEINSLNSSINSKFSSVNSLATTNKNNINTLTSTTNQRIQLVSDNLTKIVELKIKENSQAVVKEAIASERIKQMIREIIKEELQKAQN